MVVTCSLDSASKVQTMIYVIVLNVWFVSSSKQSFSNEWSKLMKSKKYGGFVFIYRFQKKTTFVRYLFCIYFTQGYIGSLFKRNFQKKKKSLFKSKYQKIWSFITIQREKLQDTEQTCTVHFCNEIGEAWTFAIWEHFQDIWQPNVSQRGKIREEKARHFSDLIGAILFLNSNEPFGFGHYMIQSGRISGSSLQHTAKLEQRYTSMSEIKKLVC